MLKPMKPKQTIPNNMFLWILVGLLVLAGIVALITAFSGGGDGTDEVNAVYTNAAATLAAQQLTMQGVTSTATATLFAQTPTSTNTPFASPTPFPTISGGSLPSSNNSSSSGAVGCNNSVFVSDVTVPDDTVMTPGQTFTKTWKIQNTGSCPWTTSYKVSFVSGNAMGGTTTPLTTTVAAGASGDISVAMTAPASNGDAIGYWILTNDSGQNFGSSFYVKIKVGTTTSGTATTTRTVTPTGAVGAATATPTATSAAPAAATNVSIALTCTLGGTGGAQKEHAGNLTWTDNSTNETGFNIYINNTFTATVAPNTTTFVVPGGTFYDPGVNSTFAVEAINGSVKSAQAPITVNCP